MTEQLSLEIFEEETDSDWYFIRYDFGIYSRYTHAHKSRPSPSDGFIILMMLYHGGEEIKRLMDQNWLLRFEICKLEGWNVTHFETIWLPENPWK